MLVVGAGPTGLTLAAQLLARGIHARVIDKGAGPASQSRALSIQARTIELLDTMGLAVVVLDTSFRVKTWNWPAARMWGLRPEDAVHRDFLSLPLGGVTRLTQDALRRVLEHRRVEVVPGVAYVLPDGEQRTTGLRLAPLLGADGEPVGILGMATPDATALEARGKGKS